MTTFLLLSALLIGLALAGLVREVRRDPAHRAPCSHLDPFAPRWAGGSTGRWSL